MKSTNSDSRVDRVVAALPPNERRWLRWLKRAGWTLLAFYFVVALGMVALRFLVLPHIATYRTEIAAAVSDAVGERVEIGAIRAEWFGLHPRFELDAVKVIDRRGEEALALPYVGVSISWRSLVVGELRFKSIVLDGPDLLIRRDPQGRLFIAGLESKAGDARDGGAAAWLLKHGEVLIRDAKVEWEDESRRAIPLRLEQVEFVLQNDGRHHRFALRAEPPAEFASALDVRGHLTGRTFEQLRDWTGQIYAAFDYIDLAAWQPWLDYPVEVRNGRGAIRVWLGFGDGALTELTADVALADLEARFGVQLPLLEMHVLTGQFGAKKTTSVGLLDLQSEPGVAYEAFARQLTLLTKDNVALAPADFTARWEPPQRASEARGEIVAKTLDLAPMADLVEHFPLPDTLRTALVATAPEGTLSELRFQWTGDIESPTTYAARGRFAGFGMQPYGGAPGFNRLAGSFDVSERGGAVSLTGDKMTIAYPDVFVERAIALDTLAARVNWNVTRNGLDVRFGDVAFANADLAGTVNGSYRNDPNGVASVDINGRASRIEGKHVYKYIPKLGANTTAWLKRGIVSGVANDARFRLRGNLRDFPFDDPDRGEFKVSGRVTGGTLLFADSWPRFTDVTADLVFDGRKLRITSPRAGALGAQVSNAVVLIPNLFGDSTALIVDGQAEGPLGEFLRYIAESPVRGFVDGLTDRWTGEGRSKLVLHLELPLEDLTRAKVAGHFQFTNNAIAMGPGEPTLAQVNGRVEFTQSSASARGLTAQTLGGAVTVQLATRSSAGGGDHEFISTVQGTVDSAQLAMSLAIPVANHLHGPMQFRHTATRRGSHSQSVFESTLAGVAVDLPAPFAKPARESWPLRIERTALPDDRAKPGIRREAITASVGAIVNALAEVRNEAGRTIVERAGVGVGDAKAQLPDGPGVAIAANLKTIDLDRLLPAVDAANQKDGNPDFAVNALDLRAGTLTVGGRLFRDVALRAQFNALKLWNANINARELAGDISWEPEGKGALAARLKYLIHPERAPEPATHGDDVTQTLPALAIVADSYRFGGRELGRLEVNAVNLRRTWRLDRLELGSPDGTLVANGRWRTHPREGPERTELDVRADVKDIGKYLARFGFADTVAKGTAVLEGSVQWNGPIHRIDYASLSGNLTVKAEKGQFVKVNPGVGKLLGVLSLQSLPRRVSLDFRDVFSEGFAFDTFTGVAKIENGIAATDNLAMNGPAASVAITGKTDLTKETQDLTVRVVPTVGDSIAVAAGVALLNPILGAGAFLAQRLLKDPLGQMLAYEYQISGSWEDPKVIRTRAPQLPSADGGSPDSNPPTQ